MTYNNFPVGYQPAQIYYPPQYGQMSQSQGQQVTSQFDYMGTGGGWGQIVPCRSQHHCPTVG